MNRLLAFDLGAESGRAVLGQFDGRQLRLEILTRFANEPVRTPDGLHWDVLRLHHDILASLRKCAADHGGADSLGVDTWGVDFALLGRGGVLLGNPRHYRDPHTEGVMDAAFARMPPAELFRRTGIQFMRFNSLFQLLALQRDRSPLLDSAEKLLFMPDLFHHFLTGEKVNEYTDASTGQMLDPATRTWASGLLRAFDLPECIQGKIVAPGTVLGPLLRAVADETGLKGARVVAPATHDTAAAVAAVPARGDAWAYISSGTWSLMGVELPAPLVNDETLAANFTNEGGVGNTIRLLKNIMGLWLVQECRRTWEREGTTYTYEALMRMAEAAPPFAAVVNPNDDSFIFPADMPTALADYCKRTGQAAPDGVGPTVRLALEALALCYRWVLERLERLTGRRLETIHIVGGGSQNVLLNQFTADACGRPVVAGPVEATAVGNLLTQAVGIGLLGSPADAREVVRRSFEVRIYEPKAAEAWQGPYERFRALLGAG
jgi:rhamnulokinase